MNFPNQVLTTFIILLCISSSHAQDTKVVVVPLGGDDISQCTVATFCSLGKTTLNCPSGEKVIECTAEPKIVFLSSTLHTGNLGGVIGADAICQGLAIDAGLSGEFKAWLSGLVPIEVDGLPFPLLFPSSPSQRFTKSTGPYLLVDGTIVADDFIDLTSGWIRNPIDIDELGQPLSEEGIWTNTEPDGNISKDVLSIEDTPCRSFTSNLNDDNFATPSRTGSPFSTNNGWTSIDTQSCVNNFHLYCFEQ